MSQNHQLSARGVTLAYDHRVVVDGLDFDVAAGQITSIVGANGCGKSTLLRALARLLQPRAGIVELDGDDIHRRKSKATARILGLLPQNPIAPEGIAVADLVGRGRHPYQRPLSPWNRADYEAVAAALEATDMTDHADRAVDELSGGQRQRVWIAMALAQDTEILLLDEPTSFLDVAHQIDVLDLLTDLNRQRGTTIVMVLHDLNLAARYSDQLVAVHRGQIHSTGRPHDVITDDLVREVFGLDCRVVVDEMSGAPLVLPRGRYHSSHSTAVPAEAAAR